MSKGERQPNEPTPLELYEKVVLEPARRAQGNHGGSDRLPLMAPSAADGDSTVRELELRVHAQQGFIDTLSEIMTAGANPPPDSELMKILEHSLACAIEATESEDGALLVRDEDADQLVFVVTQGEVPSSELAWMKIPKDKGVAHWVVRHRRAAIVNDVSNDERFYSGIDARTDFRTRSILAAPVISGGRVIGVVEVLNKRDGALYTLSDQHRLELLCHFDGELLARIADRPGAGLPEP